MRRIILLLLICGCAEQVYINEIPNRQIKIVMSEDEVYYPMMKKGDKWYYIDIHNDSVHLWSHRAHGDHFHSLDEAISWAKSYDEYKKNLEMMEVWNNENSPPDNDE